MRQTILLLFPYPVPLGSKIRPLIFSQVYIISLFVCYKDRQFFTRYQIKLYVIQHILNFYWCHFCQSRTREEGNGLDVTPVLLRTKENNYINKNAPTHHEPAHQRQILKYGNETDYLRCRLERTERFPLLSS